MFPRAGGSSMASSSASRSCVTDASSWAQDGWSPSMSLAEEPRIFLNSRPRTTNHAPTTVSPKIGNFFRVLPRADLRLQPPPHDFRNDSQRIAAPPIPFTLIYFGVLLAHPESYC